MDNVELTVGVPVDGITIGTLVETAVPQNVVEKENTEEKSPEQVLLPGETLQYKVVALGNAEET
jgi:hypothetical protein